MTLWRLVGKEILHRKGNFLLFALSAVAAVGCLVAAVTLLRAHDLRTEQIVQDRIAETRAEVARRRAEARRRAAELNEAYRKIMLKFGYNLFILPAEEEMVPLHVQGTPSKYMDEQAVRTLAESGIITVRHLLPVLQQKQILIAGDRRREVFLIGTRGEVPLAHLAPKKPLRLAVAPGEIIVGHDVHRELGVNVGDTVRAVDRDFKVAKVYEARGDRDDSSVWIDLAVAQRLLAQPGRINGILALSCICTRAQLDEIRKQIVQILPGTQVRVKTSSAVIRYEARVRAAEEADAQVRLAQRRGEADVARAWQARAELRGQLESFAAWAVPMILLASAAGMAVLAVMNVRQRRCEIGILRALGLRSRQIFAAFLAKALLAGMAGACVGYAAGFLAAAAWPDAPPAGRIFDPLPLVTVLVLAPALSMLACWAPAILAARQDPAVVLREQ
jgi:hypothetical protein